MNNNKDLLKQRNDIVKGLELAYQKMILFKLSCNSPVVVSKTGGVEYINPKDAKRKIEYKWR